MSATQDTARGRAAGLAVRSSIDTWAGSRSYGNTGHDPAANRPSAPYADPLLTTNAPLNFNQIDTVRRPSVGWARQGGRRMTETNSKAAWDRFTADAQNLAGELRRNYKDADDEKKAAEIDRSLRQLGQAAEAFFASLEAATRDPQVRATTKQAARSFGSALTETFRELGDEVDKAIRKKTPPR